MTALSEAYTKDAFTALIPEVDEITASGIYEYFSDRTPVSSFPHFIHSKMLLYAKQYKDLQRNDNVRYDAMVTDYTEAKYNDSVTRESSGTTGTKTSGTLSEESKGGTESSSTGSSTGKTTVDGKTTEDTTTDSTSSSTTDTTTDETGHTDSDTQTLNKSNPMQITGTGTAGTMPALDWNTADNQQEQKGTTDTTGKTTVKGTVSDTGKTTVTGSGTDNSTTDTTGSTTGHTTENTAGTRSQTSSGSNDVTRSDTGTDKSEHTERRTGRTGRSPAELLAVSQSYIMSTKSFAWLVDRLNPCFIWSIDL